VRKVVIRYLQGLMQLVLALGILSAARAQVPVDVQRSLDPKGAVKIWNGGGTVRIIGIEDSLLQVRGAIHAGPGEFFAVGDDQAVKLGLQAAFGSGGADLVIQLPATASVWVRTASASVEIEGLKGRLDIHTVSGPITVNASPEYLYAESMAGTIDLYAETQSTRAKAGRGSLTFHGSATDLSLSTVDGPLEVHARCVRFGQFVTTDGNIRYLGDLTAGSAITLDSHSGDVEIAMPPKQDAKYELYSFRGTIQSKRNAHPVVVGDPKPRRLEFQSGGGASTVDARTFSGNIVLEDWPETMIGELSRHCVEDTE